MIDTECEFSNSFKVTFSRMLSPAPSQQTDRTVLKASWLDTPLGPMVAIGDESTVYFLDFVSHHVLESKVDRIRKKTKSTIVEGDTAPLSLLKSELSHYFAGKLKAFTTPLCLLGSPFQMAVWEELRKIPFGSTCSYADIAMLLGKPTAYRAVAQANGANNLAVVIPCHRVINANGDLGGYNSGVQRKKWLLQHEKP